MTDDIHAAAPDNTPECDADSRNVTEDMNKVNCPRCLALIRPWIEGAVTAQDIACAADGTMRLSASQARWVAETIAWNVDLDTVRLDNGDADRAAFLDALKTVVLGVPRA